MSQYINVSLSLLGLCSIVGAGVAIGSGVGMMALSAAETEQEKQTQAVVAHSVKEATNSNKAAAGSFAALGEKQ